MIQYYLCRKKAIEVREKIYEPHVSKLLNNLANLYSNLLTNMRVLLINKHE